MKQSWKLVISFVLIISLLVSVNSVFAQSKNNESFWSKVEAKSSDLSSLEEYGVKNGVNTTPIQDQNLLSRIFNSVSNNKELGKFSKINKSDFKNGHKGTFYLGKSQNTYNSYFSVYEIFDPRKENGWTLTIYYDLDRDLLLDAILTEVKGDKVTIKKRNSAKEEVFKGTRDVLKDPSCKNCDKRLEIKKENNSSLVSVIKDTVIDKTASAIGELPDASCKWISAVTCILWGILTLIGGIVCTAVTTLVCP